VVATGTNLLQHRMPRNLKLSHAPKSHTLSRKTMLTIRNSWPKSKEKLLTSLPDSDNDEDELEILSTIALAFVKAEK